MSKVIKPGDFNALSVNMFDSFIQLLLQLDMLTHKENGYRLASIHTTAYCGEHKMVEMAIQNRDAQLLRDTTMRSTCRSLNFMYDLIATKFNKNNLPAGERHARLRKVPENFRLLS